MKRENSADEMKRRDFLGAAAAAAALGGLEADASLGPAGTRRPARTSNWQCGPTLQAARTESPTT